MNTSPLCIQECLMVQEYIANVARIEYGWYGENNEVVFEVIVSVEQLEVQLKRYRDILKEKQSLTFVINLNNNRWVTLVITYQNQQFSAHYIDSLGKRLPTNIYSILTKNVVGNIIIEDFEIKQQSDNCSCFGIYALENARVINEALQNSRTPKTEASNLQLTKDLKAIREDFSKALRRRKRIESKFEVLLKFLKKLNQQKNENKSENKFNYQNANIFLLFLETLALQDPILQDADSQDPVSKLWKQKLVVQGIIDDEDLKHVQYIRSEKIFHRKADSEISPSDFEEIVNPIWNNRLGEFFQKLEKYVQQVYTKLKGEIPITPDGQVFLLCKREIPDQSNFKQPEPLLKEKDEIGRFGKTIAIDQLKNKISKFFKDAAKEGYRDTRLDLTKANKMMFEFVVNTVPHIDKIYKKSIVEPLEKIKWFRGDLIHNFYEFGDNHKLMGVELKHFIRDSKHYFFKYYYSQEVCNVLKNTQLGDDAETIKNKLKDSLKLFQDKFGKDYLAAEEDIDKENSFEFVASQLVYSKINGKSNLQRCVHEYFKLMSIIDNEEATNKREEKRKTINVPARYNKLSGKDRREIYTDFRLLKDIFEMSGKKNTADEDMYDEKKNSLRRKWLPYGILKDDFNAMVKSYVENNDYSSIYENEKIVTPVTQTLLGLKKIRKDFLDLSNQNTIDNFNKRKDGTGNKKSLELKFNSIPTGETIIVPIPSKVGKTRDVSINTDRFVQNIFEMFDNTYIQYRLVFNNIEEAFNDEMFLDYLENENLNVSNDLITTLLEIDYMAPYVARLVIKHELVSAGIITDIKLLKTIENLFKRDSYIKHLKGLLTGMTGKILKNILKPNDKKYNECSIKPEFYKEISKIFKCKVNEMNIENMHLVFEESEYTEGILNALSNQVPDEETTALIKNILKVLNSIADKLYYKGSKQELDLALKLLNRKKGTLKSLINKEFVKRNDLVVLKAKRSTALIKIKQGKLEADTGKAKELYEISHSILLSIKDNIEKSLSNDALFSQFLLTLSDLAYTQHLLHKYQESYTEYKNLYKRMIEFTLNLSNGGSYELKDIYNRVAKSDKYHKILELSPKYLNILKIRSDIAYELTYLADAKYKSLPNKTSPIYEMELDKVLKHYQNALNIYEEVYEMKYKNAVDRYIVKTMCDIAYVHNILGSLKLCNYLVEEKLEQALSHYREALEKYEKVLEVQTQEMWETHPAVLSTKRGIVKAKCNIANTNNKLCKLKLQGNLALKRYKKAFDKSCKIQKLG